MAPSPKTCATAFSLLQGTCFKEPLVFPMKKLRKSYADKRDLVKDSDKEQRINFTFEGRACLSKV